MGIKLKNYSMRLVLASASPARAKVFQEAGLVFEQIASRGVDEDQIIAQNISKGIEACLLLLSDAKALEIAINFNGDAFILGCDSMFEFKGKLIGKPKSSKEALQTVMKYRNKKGTLHTAHTLYQVNKSEQAEAKTFHNSNQHCGDVEKIGEQVVSTTIEFADFSEQDTLKYVESGEPLNVAGSFAIDSKGSAFIKSIVGDYHSVVGVSVNTLRELLPNGYSITDFWA
jgi:septum formation protein